MGAENNAMLSYLEDDKRFATCSTSCTSRDSWWWTRESWRRHQKYIMGSRERKEASGR
ncbi:MAG: hypothetical protein HFH97_04575 [Lachnospiraceae bacterium]|nr:hypothetical protein [Lachnospiraceae bacterium]